MGFVPPKKFSLGGPARVPESPLFLIYIYFSIDFVCFLCSCFSLSAFHP